MSQSVFAIVCDASSECEPTSFIVGLFATKADADKHLWSMAEEAQAWEIARKEHDARWKKYEKTRWPKGARTVDSSVFFPWWDDFCKIDPQPEYKPHFLGHSAVVEIPLGQMGIFWPPQLWRESNVPLTNAA